MIDLPPPKRKDENRDEILSLTAQGFSASQIAKRLGITCRKVAYQRNKNSFKKLEGPTP